MKYIYLEFNLNIENHKLNTELHLIWYFYVLKMAVSLPKYIFNNK